MSFIGNVIWWIFGGLFSAIGYFLGGLVLCLTIVGIPFGMQCFRMAGAVLSPFGKEVQAVPSEQGVLGMIFNLIWILVAGWGVALTHLTSAAILAVTIIGIPFALQHLKLIVVSLFPFGYRLE